MKTSATGNMRLRQLVGGILAWVGAASASGLPATVTFRELIAAQPSQVIVYQTTTLAEQRLFVFQSQREANDTPRPATVWIHGGGWTGGDIRTFFPLARYHALCGAVGICVEYRLVRPGESSMADSIADCQAAVRYVRAHARDLGIDPARIAVAGESAGGHLAACTATLPETTSATLSARPDALVLYNPCIDFVSTRFWHLAVGLRALPASPPDETQLRRCRELSPLHHVRAGMPPTLIVHGLEDTVIDPAQARQFAAAMRAAGNRCELQLLENTPHAFLVPAYKSSEAQVAAALRPMSDFLAALGWLKDAPAIIPSEPPAWIPKSPAPAAR